MTKAENIISPVSTITYSITTKVNKKNDTINGGSNNNELHGEDVHDYLFGSNNDKVDLKEIVEHTPETQKQLEELTQYINNLMKSKGSKEGEQSNYELLAFIRRTLRQFRFDDGYYYEIDIILDAQEIGKKKIKKGEKINNIPGWLNKTSFNIIRNLSRKRTSEKKALKKLENRDYLLNKSQYFLSEDISEKQLEILQENWSALTKLEKKILILREVRGLRWKEIAEKLKNDGDESHSYCLESKKKIVQNLRQKGKRALEKLRRKF